MQISKYDILLVNLNPTLGSEQKGIRPCLVVQNNNANQSSNTTVVCPITSSIKDYPHTIIINPSNFNNLDRVSRIDLLQIRTIDELRILKKIGVLDPIYKEEFKEKFNISFDLDDMF
jgi:mRNA interferase MazF